VLCVLWFVVCFEKYVSGGSPSKNLFRNYHLKRFFQCLKSENTSEEFC
jgi:hypothetical protein